MKLCYFCISRENNWQVKIVRMILDIVMVVVGVLLGGKFGICTIVTVIISGPVIQLVNVRQNSFLRCKSHIPVFLSPRLKNVLCAKL